MFQYYKNNHINCNRLMYVSVLALFTLRCRSDVFVDVGAHYGSVRSFRDFLTLMSRCWNSLDFEKLKL